MKLFWRVFLMTTVAFSVISGILAAASISVRVRDIEDRIQERNRNLAGQLVAEIERGAPDRQWPFEMLRKAAGDPDFLFWWIVSPDGRIFLADKAAVCGSAARAAFPGIPDEVAEEGYSFADKARRRGIMINSANIRGDRWQFWLGFSTGAALHSARREAAARAGIFLLGLMVFAGLIYYTIGRYLRPVKALVEVAGKIGAGDLSRRVTVPSGDELGVLADAFNAMAEKLEYRTVERGKAEDLLKEERGIFIGGPNVVFKRRAVRGWPVEYVSPNISDQFGFNPEDFICGRTMYESIIHPEDIGMVSRELLAYSAGQAPFVELEYRIATKAGVYRWVRDFTVGVRDGAGALSHYNGYIRDVTMQKRTELELQSLNKELETRVLERTAELSRANLKLQEVDKLKSMFIASMSHELRTPLNSIIGYSSIMIKEWCGTVNSEQKENLSSILNAGRHLHRLINDVIDVSKIEAGKLEIVTEEFDLYDLVHEAMGLVKIEKADNGLKFSVEAVHQNMHTDRRRLLQCLLNLLGNAVKFTKEGEVSVRAGAVKSPSGAVSPDRVEITVTDTGIGIRAEDFPRLFSPFVRLSSPLKDRTRGTGLGLYLIRKLVTEVLQGEITMSSVYGRGSSFLIRVPVRIEGEH